MTTQSAASPTPVRTGKPPWLKRVIVGAIAAAVLIVTYFILAAFIPRWWSQRIADFAHGEFTPGIAWGLFFGIVCTAVPLILLLFAGFNFRKRVRNRPVGRYIAGGLSILALVISLPNIMTVSYTHLTLPTNREV